MAAALGYFMFYGRLSDVYLGVITLTFTLILFSVMRRTSGPEYKIGDALLGGFNGISSPPIEPAVGHRPSSSSPSRCSTWRWPR